MSKRYVASVALAGLLAGCAGSSKTLTPNQKVAAAQHWNAARAGALANLAADQYKEGNFDKCGQTLDQALRLQPDDFNLHLLAARLGIEQGKLEFADTHLSAARRLDGTNAEVEYLAGVVQERWQRPDAARAAYAAAVMKNPGEVAYVLAQAEMLVAVGRFDDALALMQTKARQFDYSGVLRDAIGLLLAGQKRYDEAILALRDASRLSPDDPTIREHLAFTLFSAKRYAEAADVFERLLKLADHERRADVHGALGECHAQARRFPEARKAFETATSLLPSCAGYWLGLGKAAAQSGDLAGADVAVRKAISLDAASSESQCLLGYIRLRQDQLIPALVAFRAASNLDPRDGLSVCMQGYVLARMGLAGDARAAYAKALEIDPRNALAAQLLKTTEAQASIH